MKNCLITASFLFISIASPGQDYNSFFSNSGWCCEMCAGLGCYYLEFTVTGTEYVNDELYNTITIPASNTYYLQEDTESRKVWYQNDNDKELLYDFSLVVNDSFQVEILDSIEVTYYVEEVDTISTLVGNRKRWILNMTDTILMGQDTVEQSLIWIEGVGSTYGPIFTKYIPNWFHGTCLEGAYSSEGLQTYQGDCNYIFGYWPEECKFINSGIEDIYFEPTVAFFNGYGDLEISSSDLIKEIRIYDVKGSFLMTHNANIFERRLVIANSLPTGIYFCETIFVSNTSHCIKAIKAVQSP